MKLLRTLTILSFVFLLNVILCAQSNTSVTLTGKIVESDSQVPLEFATISIFNSVDKSLLKGEVSDATGTFSINIDQKDVYLEIAYIGLATKKIENFVVDNSSGIADLGIVALTQSAIQLQDIVIEGEKSLLKFDLDKKVFNVDKDVSSASTNALDVLDQVPSVSVDPNGKISIRGSGGITILIDGKPSVLANAQQLQNLLPEKLDRIEVITNPSAKYDAAGIAGILNIVMKKEEVVGISGSATIKASHPHDYSLGVGLSRRKRKMNLFGDVSLRKWSRPRSSFRENQLFTADEILTSDQFTDQIRRSLSIEVDGGFDFYFNEKNVLTTSLIYEGGRQPHDATIDYKYYSPKGDMALSQRRTNDELEFESSLEYLLNFEKTYEKEGKKLRAFMKYTSNKEDNSSVISQSTYDENFIVLDELEIKQRTSVDETDQTFVAQFDFEQPIGKSGKLELGGKSSMRNITNQFLVEQSINGGWTNIGTLSNDFDYQERIYALYITESNKIGKFRYQFGLRGEVTDLSTQLKESEEVNDRKPFFNLFPSGHISYESSNRNELQLSYSRRIDRPRFYQLNPFFSYTDNRFISIGNPNLNPMFTNSFELSHIKSWEEFSINSSIYHRDTRDNIEHVIEVDDQGVSYIQPQNLSSEKSTGIEVFLEASPKKWIRLNVGVEGRKVILKGLGTASDFINWSSSFSSRVRLPKKANAQLRIFYVGKGRGIQGEIGSRSRLDFSINKQLMDGKARISFSIMDILQSFRYEYEQITSDAKSTVIDRPWRRTFSLSFSYRWK